MGIIVKSHMRNGKMVKGYIRGSKVTHTSMPNPQWSIHSKEYKKFRKLKTLAEEAYRNEPRVSMQRSKRS